MKKEIDQVREQLSEVEVKMKKDQLKRLQKRLIATRNELTEVIVKKDLEIKQLKEQIEKMSRAYTFGTVFITDYIGDISYELLISAIKDKENFGEANLLAEVNKRLEDSTFQRVFACIDSEALTFYDSSMKECLSLNTKFIEVANFHIDNNDALLILINKTEHNFLFLKISEMDIRKWVDVFDLKVNSIKSQVFPTHSKSELHYLEDYSLPKLLKRDTLKEEDTKVQEEIESETKEDRYVLHSEDRILKGKLSRKSNDDILQLSPSVTHGLQPINEEVESSLPNISPIRDEGIVTFDNHFNDSISMLPCYRETNEVLSLEEFDNQDDSEMTLEKAKEILKAGFIFKKYEKTGHPHFRCVWLDGNKINCKNIESNSVCDSILLKSISEIKKGRDTINFKRFLKVGKVQEASSFSIIGTNKTLDLEANEPAKKDKFIKALELIRKEINP